MIECIFTLDYEIFATGEGSLQQLVYEPAKKLKSIFDQFQQKFVVFVEAAEFEMIERFQSDETIGDIMKQIRNFHRDGFEIGLHIHPEWYGAKYEGGCWFLDRSEYNLCKMEKERISQLLDQSIGFLQSTLESPDFAPISFRAGNWLLQPTEPAASVLAEKGIKIDSSVFKGGLQRLGGLDYRPALKNGFFWKFGSDVNQEDPPGPLFEIPIYSKMVPSWTVMKSKRVGLQKKDFGMNQSITKKLLRLMDFARIKHPLKMDFCNTTSDKLLEMIDELIEEDQKTPDQFKPIVLIGHTKDLVDFETVEYLLSYLDQNKIKVSTFEEIYENINVHG